MIQAEKDEVAKHSRASVVTPSTPFPVSGSGHGCKPSVFSMFKDLIHPQRCASPSQWDLSVVDKHGIAILNNSIEQVMKEYNNDIYNMLPLQKVLFWIS